MAVDEVEPAVPVGPVVILEDVGFPVVVVVWPLEPPDPAAVVGVVVSSAMQPLLITKCRGMTTAVMSRTRFMGTLRKVRDPEGVDGRLRARARRWSPEKK
jgi:hypothetical protein